MTLNVNKNDILSMTDYVVVKDVQQNQKVPVITVEDLDRGIEFTVTGDSDYVAHQFGQHADEIHGIDYHIEAINQIIARKKTVTK